jgi:hypothetical protein
MRTHVKILGIIYCAFACFLGAFILLGLIFQALHSLGVGRSSGAAPGWGAAVVVIFAVGYPAFLLFQLGQGLLKFRRWSRMVAIILASILMVGLNVILLLTKDRPGTAGVGWIAFHFISIGVGVYTLLVLAPSWGKKAFQEQAP